MNHFGKKGMENGACNLELDLLDTKEQLELERQKVIELQSVLRDRENEIIFLKEILLSRTTLISHQVNTITSLSEKLRSLEKESPVIVMKTFVPEKKELVGLKV